MFTPAATAARIARMPECAYVPSPRFWNTCFVVGERRLADPRGALAAHLRERDGVAIHPGRHVVAADAADRAAALGHARRSVVRAARAEVRLPLHFDRDGAEPALLLLEEAHALPRCRCSSGSGACGGASTRAIERRSQLAGRRQQPLAALVALADDQRPLLRLPVVQLLLQLILDDAALLLDDEDFLEPVGEFADRFRLERPAHADLEDLDADLARALGVDAEILERLQHVEVCFARRHDTEARIRGCRSRRGSARSRARTRAPRRSL